MKNLKAVAKFPLGRRWVKPGDTFSLEDKEADLLVKVGKATYQTRQMKAEENGGESEPKKEVSPRTGRQKRQYNRRDMKADA